MFFASQTDHPKWRGLSDICHIWDGSQVKQKPSLNYVKQLIARVSQDNQMAFMECILFQAKKTFCKLLYVLKLFFRISLFIFKKWLLFFFFFLQLLYFWCFYLDFSDWFYEYHSFQIVFCRLDSLHFFSLDIDKYYVVANVQQGCNRNASLLLTTEQSQPQRGRKCEL